jgi:hypothetical protein
MKIKKIVVTVEVEVLSIDSVYARLVDAAKQINDEQIHGKLCSDDGDTVSWNTVYNKEVEL